MKNAPLVIALFCAASLGLQGQVTVELELPQEQFLAGDAVSVAVKIKNLSGQTLALGAHDDWLTFVVESTSGYVVAQNEAVPVKGEFQLESSSVATKRVD